MVDPRVQNRVDFVSDDRHEVVGRGLVYVVELLDDCVSPGWLAGRCVTINGVSYRCDGVERFGHLPPYCAGERVGLLVTPL